MVVHPLSTSPRRLRPAGDSGQAILRHPDAAIYRCFLPDLTGFIGFCRAGPSRQRSLLVADLRSYGLEREFNPAIAGCGFRAPLAPRLARPNGILTQRVAAKSSKPAFDRQHRNERVTRPYQRAIWQSRKPRPPPLPTSLMPHAESQAWLQEGTTDMHPEPGSPEPGRRVEGRALSRSKHILPSRFCPKRLRSGCRASSPAGESDGCLS